MLAGMKRLLGSVYEKNGFLTVAKVLSFPFLPLFYRIFLIGSTGLQVAEK